MNKIIPYGKQHIGQEDIDAVVKVLKDDFLTQGPLVEAFEKDLANYLNSKHVVVVSNGTAALHLASLALELKAGDAVIVPAVTFVATSNSVMYCGATPVFADVDPQTGNVSLESAEKAYHLAKSNGLNVRAIYPVHFSGNPCAPNEILQFAKKYELKIVEDACHALGAQYRKSEQEEFSMVGTFADMAVWSFHPVKHITAGEGGAISTNNDELAQKLRLFRSHGITKDSSKFLIQEQAIDSVTKNINSWYYEMQSLGFNYRLPDILCALGITQLRQLPKFIKRRREIANHYYNYLKDVSFIQCLDENDSYAFSSYHLFPVLIDLKALDMSKNQIMETLGSQGVGSQVHYIPVPWQPYYRNYPKKFLSEEIPHASKFYEEVLSLPMYYDLTDEEILKVIQSLKYLENNK